MSTSASLDSTSVQMEAGQEVVVPLQIRNNGEIVEGYRIEVVGPPADWATVEPETVSLYPGSDTTATLSFHPPRSSRVPAGEQQFGVVITPVERPDEAVVPEGVVEVLPYFETTAELVPRTSQGRRRARHQVAVDNRGNVPVTAWLSCDDPTKQLRFRVHPEGMTVQPGEALFVDVHVRPAKSLWRGAPVTHPFTVEVAPQDSTGVVLDGTYLQQPLVPPWLGKALLALLLLLATLAATWFLLLKQTVESAAKDAVKPQVEKAASDAASAEKQAAAAQDSAESARGAAGNAEKSAKTAAEIIGEPPPPKIVTRALSERMRVDSANGSTRTAEPFTVPKNSTLALTDFVLSNPQGDFGRVEVQLNDRVLFDMALENFRDIDYHFVSPIAAKAGDVLVMRVRCRKPGEPPGQRNRPERCDTSMYFGGELTRTIQRRN